MRNLMRLVPAACLAVLLAQAVPPAHADAFENIALSADESGAEPADSFSPDTPKIHLNTQLDDVAAGSKVTAAWIAVDSGGAAPPNYKIDEATVEVGSMTNHFHAALSRPDNGWPVGTYEVQLAVDGEVVETVPFVVK